jgi:hypothetical protein
MKRLEDKGMKKKHERWVSQRLSADNHSSAPIRSLQASGSEVVEDSLGVFLCHSSNDKAVVRDLYQRLWREGIDPWLDEQKLLPGQDWPLEIANAVRTSHAVIVCLSQSSVSEAGYVQMEIKYALDVADLQPEGAIFIIPLRLEECDVPNRLRHWQWVDLFDDNGYERLMLALRKRAATLDLTIKPRLPRSAIIRTSHGKFVAVDNAKEWLLVGNADQNTAERFTICRLSNGKIAFKSSHDKYVTATNDYTWTLKADAQEVGEAQQFVVITQGDERWVFKTANNTYITAMNDEGDRNWVLRAETSMIQAWEKFTLIPIE